MPSFLLKHVSYHNILWQSSPPHQFLQLRTGIRFRQFAHVHRGELLVETNNSRDRNLKIHGPLAIKHLLVKC